MNSPQTICSFCIMDTTDSEIQFFGTKGCNHCINARARLQHDRFPGPAGEARLESLIAHIRKKGGHGRYDCLVGLSGGVDSSYLLYKAKKMGLRPLAVHVDNSWNSELAVNNIQHLIRALGVDLITLVIDWEEIRDLQRACFSVPLTDIEIISDHAIFAGLYQTAARNGIKFILSGTNVATESILPPSWGYDKRDSKHVLAVHKKYGSGVALRSYPWLSPLKFLYYVLIRGIRFVPILNYGDYNKQQAIDLLQREYGWRPYPNKHGESTFTRFFQDYYLPQKFGFDKRKAHLSSLICSGEITREAALEALKKPLYDPGELAVEKDYVLKKLGYSEAEFQKIMAAPPVPHKELPNNAWMFNVRNPLVSFIRRLAKFEISTPSR
jgi:aminotransferase